MPFLPVNDEGEQKKKLLEFYNQFMAQQNAKPKVFNSLDEFKKSPDYQELSEHQQELLGELEGKNVVIMLFDTREQAEEFIKQAKTQGLIDEGQAQSAMSFLDQQEENSHRMST